MRAERVIVALPPALAGRIRYSPALPGRRDQLTQQVPMGAVIKCRSATTSRSGARRGLSGFVVSLDDRSRVMFDNSPQDRRCGVLLGFFEGEHATAARRSWTPTSGARSRSAASRSTSASVRCTRSSTSSRTGPPRSSHAAATAGAWATGVWTRYAQALSEPVGRIHWAGTETADVWNGYMDGAVRSGERAAEEALTALAESTAVA